MNPDTSTIRPILDTACDLESHVRSFTRRACKLDGAVRAAAKIPEEQRVELVAFLRFADQKLADLVSSLGRLESLCALASAALREEVKDTNSSHERR